MVGATYAEPGLVDGAVQSDSSCHLLLGSVPPLSS